MTKQSWRQAMKEWDEREARKRDKDAEVVEKSREWTEDMLRAGLCDDVEGDPDYVPPPMPTLIWLDDRGNLGKPPEDF